MKWIPAVLLLFVVPAVYAQQQTFDLVTYTEPKGWKKESREGLVMYSIVDNEKNTWCQLGIVKSTDSKGSIEQDFDTDWQELVVSAYKVTGAPQANEVEEAEGWKIKAGAGKFTFNNADALVMLTTISGYGKRIAIVSLTNTQEYIGQVQDFMASMNLEKPAPVAPPVTQQTITTATTAAANGFAFTTTNFDDGWVSTVQDDWVQVTKENIKVLLHFTTRKLDESSNDYRVVSDNAWNTLVAPRYSNLQNYFNFGGTADYQRPSFVSGDVTDNVSGKNVHVVLFKKASSGWIEIICADKNSFVQQFGIDISKVDYYVDSKIWDPLLKLSNYNKFAVAAADLTGKWTNNFTGMQQYVNAYTGANAGMNTYSSNQVYEFTAGGAYKWEITVASGFVGSIKFQNVKSSGKLTLLNNWQIKFSDMEGKPKTYNVQFSCIKGARLLWIDETSFGRAE